MQNVVAAWFANGLNNYWFVAIGLAAAYYLIPKVINGQFTATISQASAFGRGRSLED
jgi:hypothetical protein